MVDGRFEMPPILCDHVHVIHKTIEIKLRKIHENAITPSRATEESAGYDLSSVERVEIEPGKIAIISTGWQSQIDPRYELQIRSRSGLACKFGVAVVNSPGTIDSDYRGEIKVGLINHGEKTFVVEPGMRIAQMILNELPQCEIKIVESLDYTARGSGGLGHTGLK